jgi:hypothetical protein
VTLKERFQRYHAENPHIYEALRRFAFEARHAGRTRIGLKLLYNRVRWDTTVAAKDGTGFKLDDRYVGYYSRLLMAQEPELRGMFKLRRLKEAA